MQSKANRLEASSAIRSDLGAIFVSMELSRSIWLITSLSPGGGEKMSKHSVPAGDVGALLAARFSGIRQKALTRTELDFGQFMRRMRAHFPCAPKYGVEFRYCPGVAGT